MMAGGNESSFISFSRVFFNKYIQFEMKHSNRAATAPAPIMKQKAHISQGGEGREEKEKDIQIFLMTLGEQSVAIE